MDRVAVFVDAGYLFVAGSEAIAGQKQRRSDIRLNTTALTAELKRIAEHASGLPLLRIYWYDGTSGVMSTQQINLAKCDDIKVRLGAVNSHGEQKGVDSLIITDMISLARNRAMADAVLISGDEDIRVGMQQAQEWGVRVHLVGIDAGRHNQSPSLLQEADTCSSLSADDVRKFMSVVLPANPAPATVAGGGFTPRVVTGAGAEILQDVVAGFLAELTEEQIRTCGDGGTRSVPGDLDGRLLVKASGVLGRRLDRDEMRELRKSFLGEARRAASA